MRENHWLLDAIKEMEEYADANGLQGLVEGLGQVLEVYAAEAMVYDPAARAVAESLKK